MALPVYRLPAAKLGSALAGLRDFRDLQTRFDATVPKSSAFDNAFASPCLADVDRTVLFQAVCQWALEELQVDDPHVLPTAPAEEGWAKDVRQYSARRCRGILANALLGNVMDVMAKRKRNQGGLCFSRLGPEKVAAFLLYFQAGLRLRNTTDDERVVRFEHIRCPPMREVEDLLASYEAPLLPPSQEPPLVRLHDEGMEAPTHATAFVNFANAQFGFGKFIDSCTQEEILQQCCPEFNIGMLFIGTMAEDEVVVVHNCRRFVAYRGYSNTFEVTGPAPGPVQAILTLDACISRHFDQAMVLRDIRKAYTAFAALHGASNPPTASLPLPVVSTGRWGCGVFGGTPAHKFLQQVVAARLANVCLEFSTFGKPYDCDLVLNALGRTPVSVKQAWGILQRCTNANTFADDAVRCVSGDDGGWCSVH